MAKATNKAATTNAVDIKENKTQLKPDATTNNVDAKEKVEEKKPKAATVKADVKEKKVKENENEPEVKDKFAQKAKESFSLLGKEIKKLFFTSDGFPFAKEHDALLHARTLQDKEITSVNR